MRKFVTEFMLMINDIKLNEFLDQFRKFLPPNEFKNLRKILQSGSREYAGPKKNSKDE